MTLTYSTTSNSSTLSNTILYNGNWDNSTVVYKPYYGDPLWLTPSPAAEAAARPESDMEWLTRRVDEIRWIPA